MIYARWVLLAVFMITMNVVNLIAAPILSLFTAKGWPEWGGWFWTFDNPPQGDAGWINKRCYFPQVTTGMKGYLNRVGWLWRNPVYGLGKLVGVEFDRDIGDVYLTGDFKISDRTKQPGKRFTRYFIHVAGWMKLQAFEFYMVRPYKRRPNRCLRIRLGWKIGGGSLQEKGFGMFVCVINPFMSYGG